MQNNIKKVLLVEDDTALATGIKYALENENFSVMHSGSYTGAMELIDSKEFDLAILDVMLPGGNGYDICKQIRKIKQSPVIFLTACDEEVNVIMGLDMGGDDYITKPFRVKELLSRIKAVLRRYEQQSIESNSSQKKDNTIIYSNDLTINLIENKVLIGECVIELTPTEYKLLLYFINNPNITIKRSILLEKLWDYYGEFVDDNTLSVYIRRLREKIEKEAANPHKIVTVRGIGYKWIEE